MPWSGRVLGEVDVGFVAGRAKPFIVAIIGPQNAGKTTLLAAWYLLLNHGLDPTPDQRFAGSFSLEGWEAIASSLRWAPGAPPTFPAHTTSREGRTPGLLHLSFRQQGRLRDFLFTDAPGEWFQKWALNADAPEAEGARWLSRHADAFLFIADCEALSGNTMGSARGATQLLARRLGSEQQDRPVALVWTKSDIPVSDATAKSIRSVTAQISNLVEFEVSVISEDESASKYGKGLTDLLRWLLELRRSRTALPRIESVSSDPLFLFGTRN
ncbi:MAG TPA: hypothetical protein VFB79_05730 [Candidatus Angelobacter sp.]|nr:hypothetical protein [Candidatus Angelobacter sp.]